MAMNPPISPQRTMNMRWLRHLTAGRPVLRPLSMMLYASLASSFLLVRPVAIFMANWRPGFVASIARHSAGD
ncbi:hypothetical protein [Ferrovibrio sp.]|uniref:hypothetical protein n=1 Tax=Ferrovibrio sp. TaxID=1917215 RepID=UPI003D0C602F